MHAHDILKYGHLTLLGALDELDPSLWTEGGACGWWSVKDIVGHLASYELMLADVAASLQSTGARTEVLDRFRNPEVDFNDVEVSARSANDAEEALAEYNANHRAASEAIAALDPGMLRVPGVLAWYGDAYDLEDFLVYTFYGHKREHAAQVAAFRDLQGGS